MRLIANHHALELTRLLFTQGMAMELYDNFSKRRLNLIRRQVAKFERHSFADEVRV
jgi:hypothetical protein